MAIIIARFSACWVVSSPLRFFHYWSLFAAYIHTIYCFSSRGKLLCIFLCSLYAILQCCFTLSPLGVFILHFYLLCRILSLISYSVMAECSVLRFLSLCVTLLVVFLLLINSMLCG